MKYSPSGKFLATGFHNCASKVEIMSLVDNAVQKYAVHNANLTGALTHLDWSKDGELLKVNSANHEVKFVNAIAKQNVAA